MIQKLQQIFHSITKSLDVLYVIEGAKPCSRILVHEDKLSETTSFLNKNGLFAAISDFKVVKYNTQSEFYSDKSIKIQKNAPQKGYFFVYLSKDKTLAQNAKVAEENNNHKEFGKILGYPDCCCDFFAKNFNEKNTDLTLKTLENSNGYKFQFYANIAARHFDISLLSHFPHSFECKPSIEIAKKNLRALAKNSQQIADMFLNILQSVVIYTTEEGVFLLRKYEVVNGEVIYGDILTTTKSKLYFLLSSNKNLRINDKNDFVVSDISIKGKQYGIMVFS